MAAIKQEPFTDMQRKNLDTAMHLAQIGLENTQRIVELQVDTTKAIFDEAIEGMRALAEAKDTRAAMDIRNKIAQSAGERIIACTRKIAELSASTQTEVGRMMTQQFGAASADMVEGIQRMMQGMPVPGAETMNVFTTALDSTRVAVEQMTRASQEAFSNLTNLTTRAAGAATKTATAAIIEPFTPRVATIEAVETSPVAAAGKKAAKHE